MYERLKKNNYEFNETNYKKYKNSLLKIINIAEFY